MVSSIVAGTAVAVVDGTAPAPQADSTASQNFINITINDSENGQDSATTAITVTQESGATPELVSGTPAADTSGDGKLDDFNGNGAIDRGDAQALFDKIGTNVVQNNVAQLDRNGNGEVDRGDVQALFDQT